ncbi:MAG TPA: carbohydrate ABC transporter permease [Halanaerobiales bacterium]|nr:carbohydrate ABC transporter permease [Halanaerobiales bacterium]HPZ62789.1 carbohydrate ABC transporter permease [Halanaerobiales bacterium]HQD04302.1 carbohydrate ABC transporter permease [Halanaerobiales bacterium]
MAKLARFRKRRSTEDILLDAFVYIFLICLIVVTLYPFLNTVAVSFNDGLDSLKGGIYLWPRKFTTFNYRMLLARPQIYQAVKVTLARTVLSTVLGVFSTAILAYTISRKEFVLRKFISTIYVITLYVNGGLIPTYFVYRFLGLTNSFWVYIWPAILHAFNLIIVRTYISGLPESLIESAKIDGAGEFTIFLRIIFPLIKPVLAVVALFTAVAAWNSWFDVFVYNPMKPELSTLAYELQKVLASAQQMSTSMELAMSRAAAGANEVTPRAIRATMTVIVTVPIACIYPFLQKYFVHGLTLGGVKE